MIRICYLARMGYVFICDGEVIGIPDDQIKPALHQLLSSFWTKKVPHAPGSREVDDLDGSKWAALKEHWRSP